MREPLASANWGPAARQHTYRWVNPANGRIAIDLTVIHDPIALPVQLLRWELVSALRQTLRALDVQEEESHGDTLEG